jgi:protein-S-isoprenylcysteine O-methyltransferase Ste14
MTVDHPPVNAAGAVLLGAGAIVAIVAQSQMGRAWRAGIELSTRHELVVGGLFGIVRNPFYTGILTASAGVVLMTPNVTSIAGWLALLIGSETDVRMVEEPHLRSVHGPEYATYEHSTPRFLPSPRLLWQHQSEVA